MKRALLAAFALGFVVFASMGFTFTSYWQSGWSSGNTLSANLMNELRVFLLAWDSSVVFVETPVTHTTIEAALDEACTANGNRLQSCKQVIVPNGAHTLTETVHFTGTGEAPSASTAEGIWGLNFTTLAAGGYIRTGQNTASDEDECGAMFIWGGSTTAPMFHLHGVRRSVFKGFCMVLDGDQDGVNEASVGILVTATNGDGEVSQGVLIDNVDIWGFSGDWDENANLDTTCILLAPSDYSGDPPYNTDAQIDNLIIQNSRLQCRNGYIGANGNTNGVYVLNTVNQYSEIGYWVEDSDLHIVGGYSDTLPGYGQAGAHGTACDNTNAWLLIGSTSVQQPKNVVVTSHNLEADCGRAIGTVDATDSANQRDTATNLIGVSLNVGAAGVDHAIEYTHFGSFSMSGTVGIRNSEDYNTAGRSFFAFEPVTASSQKTLRLTLDIANLDDWDAGSLRVTRNSFIDLIGADELASDAILERHFKAVDSAADEECLTYEETTGDFEWQTCGSGGVSDGDKGDIVVGSSGASWTLDNDVVAAAEMADADHGDISWSGGVASIDADAVALSTDTTGNYVATIADSGASEVTVTGSGSEGAAVTLGIASSITRDSELSAYTVGTAAPVDGSDACTEGDMWLDHTANKVYWCVDSATDDWFGVALSDTP